MRNWWVTLEHINKMRINEQKSVGSILIWYPLKKRESINKSIKLLVKAGFLKSLYEASGRPDIVKIKNIPPGLTTKDARMIAKNPWFLWFKFPEHEVGNANL